MKLGSHIYIYICFFFFKMQGNIPRNSFRLTKKWGDFYPAYFIVAIYFFIITVMMWALNACNWG